MKVCLFADAQSVHVRQLVRALASRGITVHVVTHKPAELPGASVERFSIPPPGMTNLRRWEGRRRDYLRRFLQQFDVVNIHFLADWGFGDWITEVGQPRAAVVATAWGSDIVDPPGETPATPELVSRRIQLLRAADAVTVCGPTFAQVVARYADIPLDSIEVVRFGVDLDLFTPPGALRPSEPQVPARRERGAVHLEPRTECNPGAPGARGSEMSNVEWRRANDTGSARSFFDLRYSSFAIPDTASRSPSRFGPRVGFFKGFRAVYGPISLIRAVPLVVEQVPDARFDLIGDGAELAACQALARELNVEPSIEWIPRQDHSALPSFLSRWDVSVIPSVHEAFGVAALESSAMKVPVVASDVCGLRDTVRDGETGLLVPPGDPPRLAEAIVRLLRDAGLRERMGEAGRQMVEREYNWQTVADQWVDFYRRIRTSLSPAHGGEGRVRGP